VAHWVFVGKVETTKNVFPTSKYMIIYDWVFVFVCFDSFRQDSESVLRLILSIYITNNVTQNDRASFIVRG
jgi:hypothetical protein